MSIDATYKPTPEINKQFILQIMGLLNSIVIASEMQREEINGLKERVRVLESRKVKVR